MTSLRLFRPDGEQPDHAGMAARPTVSQVLREFQELERDRYSPRSFADRKAIWDRFAAEHGDRVVADCTPRDALRWIKHHFDNPSTRRSTYSSLCAPFNWAVRVQMIEANPFRGLQFDEGEPRAVTEAEFRAMLRAAERNFRQPLWFCWLTGCRPGEMAALCWEWVDLEAGCCTLADHKTRKKTRKARVIPLLGAAVGLLAKMRAERIAAGGTAQGLVFVTQRGTQWNRSNLSTKMRRLKKRAGVSPDAKLHGFRHAWGTRQIADGHPLKLVAEAMGHKGSAVTEKFYCHLGGEHLARMREELARKPKGPEKPKG